MQMKNIKSTNLKFINLIISGTLLILCHTANAEETYAGIAVGQSQFDITCDLDISCTKDENGSAFKIFGGYQFNKNGAIEFGYVDLGEGTGSGEDSLLGRTSVSFEVSGLVLAGLGFLPLNQNFVVIAKVGFLRWDLDVNAISSIYGTNSYSESGTDLMFGIGASFDVAENSAIRVEWETFKDIGNAATSGESDVKLLSASYVYRF